ncbi:uncharacterized protein LOC131330637 [Rhododendron vialii]|uniref:uncharacterized protein LOC131330637 n=1 Tax=Rhododendron vialii TaxID=182163 RepID=UPI00265E8E32|nr:uncharacterized protein LOC131330637 [Rhododendron vialii]
MVEELVQNTDSPFTPKVMGLPLPMKFKMPQLEMFNGSMDPLDHLETYKSLMRLQAVPDEVMCRAFPVTLKGSARACFNKLPSGSICSFKELSTSFVSYFILGQCYGKPATNLLMDSFYTSYLKNHRKLWQSLCSELKKHMNVEEVVYARRTRDGFDPQAGPSQVGEFPPPDNKRKESTRKTGGEPKNKKVDSRSSPKRGGVGGPPQGWFHKDHGHNTDDCIDLKQQIEDLIQRGRLQRFVTNQKQSRREDTSKESRDGTTPRSGPIGEIKVIHGGFVGGGESSNARKAHLRKLRSEEHLEVNTVGRPDKFQKEEIPIIFSEEDIKGVQIPHDDSLVITIVIANYLTRRVLIDSGSSADILYLHAYDQLKVGRERLRPMTSPLVGFATYNAILGRTTLNKIEAIISTYHLMIKFPTPEGVAYVRRDQKAARECSVTSLRGANITINVESVDTQDEEKLQHGEPVEPGPPGKTVRMGIGLSMVARAELLQFLRKNKDAFAWSHEDIPGIDPRVISHKLNMDPTMRPVK